MIEAVDIAENETAFADLIEPYRGDSEVDRLHRKLYGW